MTLRARLLLALAALLCLGTTARAQGQQPAQASGVDWKAVGGAGLLALLGWWNRHATKSQNPILNQMAGSLLEVQSDLRGMRKEVQEGDERTTEELAHHGAQIMAIGGDLKTLAGRVDEHGKIIAAIKATGCDPVKGCEIHCDIHTHEKKGE